MTIYVFNEPGVIAGIPGTFAHCRVEVGEDGLPVILPLAAHPAFEAASHAEASDALAEQQAEEPPVAASSTIVPEQVTPVLNLQNMGG